MKRVLASVTMLAATLVQPSSLYAQQVGRPLTVPPSIQNLVNVPVESEAEKLQRQKPPAKDDELGWRHRFRDLRSRLDEKKRLLAIKRAEFYDKLKKGETEKKPRQFAIEGFGINTEGTGGEPRYLDPLEREVHELEKEVSSLERQLRDLNFQASLAGVPMAWRR
jgi:hypothetical protein